MGELFARIIFHTKFGPHSPLLEELASWSKMMVNCSPVILFGDTTPSRMRCAAAGSAPLLEELASEVMQKQKSPDRVSVRATKNP